ncbi:hybrid sensor histidine kinase/response regulator [Burkholderia ubonensis]|nr:PAS domain-containing hybrid sensor histidine kinase/response regulator [Burkholderia ubonensis]
MLIREQIMRMRRAHSSAQFPAHEVEAIEGERSFRSLADAIPHIMWTADPDGWVDYLNYRGLSYGGVTLEQARDQGWESFVHPDDLQPAIDVWTRAIRNGVEFEIEYRLRRASDGVYRWFLCRALPLRDRDGKIVKWFGTETDIEDLKQARAAAERANRAKSDFLSSMSHELRSPLNAILGFAQLMASDLPPPTPSQQASIEQILRAGWHLLELINDVLDLAKIESGQVAISPEPIALSDALRECESMIEPQARQRGIRVSFPDVVPDCHVRADRTRFRQILLNLLSNAIKYNRASGAVDVDCDMRVPGRIRVSVRDTGPGLSQEQLGQLFQPFNRLGQDAGGEEGTGIGLVVAKRLTELMGGAIGAESTVGKGSVFWIELDAASAPEVAARGDARPAASAERANAETAAEAPAHTVLYIEDNAANRTLVEQLLARHADMRMLGAASGQHGVALARSALPRVILMDINLPDISGIDALGMLRSQPETAEIPVVALSSNAMPRDIEKGLKAGFFRYLTKPIKIDQLMHALAEAIAFAEGKR